jgi:hypothetical protein
MKTTSSSISREQFPSWSGLTAHVLDFIALMSPRNEIVSLTNTSLWR